MALVFDEKKSSASSFVSVLIWLVLLIVIGSGFYYLFFKNPEAVPIPPPAGFAETQAIAKITLDPQAVIQSLESRGFKSQVTVPTAQTLGRQNPFLGF